MSKPTIAAIIVGIDGWEQYTLPLVESLQKHESDCTVVVVDNESKDRYPVFADLDIDMTRTPRLCYSAAINLGKSVVDMDCDGFDWYIVLSNDVLCTGPFADLLAACSGEDIVGPCHKQVHGFDYIEGWCVATPRHAWDAIGGWDERFLGSDYEDVAFSTRARQRGFGLAEGLPFVHLDQRQRYTIVENFAGKNAHNRDLFLREYAAVRA